MTLTKRQRTALVERVRERDPHGLGGYELVQALAVRGLSADEIREVLAAAVPDPVLPIELERS